MYMERVELRTRISSSKLSSDSKISSADPTKFELCPEDATISTAAS
jgi:hypothetical protein